MATNLVFLIFFVTKKFHLVGVWVRCRTGHDPLPLSPLWLRHSLQLRGFNNNITPSDLWSRRAISCGHSGATPHPYQLCADDNKWRYGHGTVLAEMRRRCVRSTAYCCERSTVRGSRGWVTQSDNSWDTSSPDRRAPVACENPRHKESAVRQTRDHQRRRRRDDDLSGPNTKERRRRAARVGTAC